MSTVDDLDATIKGCRTGAWRLALGSLGLVAALSWQPLTLMLDTLLRWSNVSMGLSRVALIACAAGSCVMINDGGLGADAPPPFERLLLRSTALRRSSPSRAW